MQAIASPTAQLVIIAAFLAAIVHSLIAHVFLAQSKELEQQGQKDSSWYSLYQLGGHLTFIFPMWLLAIFALLHLMADSQTILSIVSSADLTEPFANFTMIFLALSTRVRSTFVALVSRIARLVGGSNTAWWLSCLIIGILLDGVISEAATIVLVASAMNARFFAHGPSERFSYTTVALIFMTLSLGSLVIPFNITASMDLTAAWGWTHWTILQAISWRVALALGVLLITGAIYLRRDLQALPHPSDEELEAGLKFDFGLVGYLVAFLLAGFFENLSYVLLALVGFVCVIEREDPESSHRERLNLPLFVALFNYAMEVYAHLLSSSVTGLYSWAGQAGSTVLTGMLAGLNEHIPGSQLIEALSQASSLTQELGLLALTLGAGLAIFSSSVNIVAYKILRDRFPGGLLVGWRIPMYTVPFAILAFFVLRLSYWLA